MKYANAAVETYQKMTTKELEMKEEYYATKIKYMEKKQQYFNDKIEGKIKDLLIKEEAVNALHKLNENLSIIAEAASNL